MGIFNTITLNRPEKCPNCGQGIITWQSKQLIYDGYELANALREVKLNNKMDGEIHTACDKCNTYVSMRVKKGKLSSKTNT